MHNSNTKHQTYLSVSLESYSSTNKNATHEEYMQKTIVMKNDHINQLLQQLKMTQELHANLKKKYFSDEQKLKDKMNKLHLIIEELRAQNLQLIKKYKLFQANYQAMEAKSANLTKDYQRQLRSSRELVQRLNYQNSQLNAKIDQNQQALGKEKKQKQKLDAVNKELVQKLKEKDNQINKIKLQFQNKEEQWKRWNGDLAATLKSVENKNTQRKRMTLNEIQDKIRGIMINI